MTYISLFYMMLVAVIGGIAVGFLHYLCQKTIDKLEKCAEKNGFIVKTFTKELISWAYIIVMGVVVVLSFMCISRILANY